MTDPREAREYYENKRHRELEKQLLPCPMCGGTAHFVDFGYIHVRCVKCGVSTGNSLGIDDAVTRWNQRVADSRLAQLHSEIYHLKNRIAELDEELAIKQSIINRQVAMMGEMEHEGDYRS